MIFLMKADSRSSIALIICQLHNLFFTFDCYAVTLSQKIFCEKRESCIKFLFRIAFNHSSDST